jgi:hypothetical protein
MGLWACRSVAAAAAALVVAVVVVVVVVVRSLLPNRNFYCIFV